MTKAHSPGRVGMTRTPTSYPGAYAGTLERVTLLDAEAFASLHDARHSFHRVRTFSIMFWAMLAPFWVFLLAGMTFSVAACVVGVALPLLALQRRRDARLALGLTREQSHFIEKHVVGPARRRRVANNQELSSAAIGQDAVALTRELFGTPVDE